MKNFQRKKFLNKDGYHSIAAIAVNLDDPLDNFVTGSIQISDCSRIIELHLDLLSEKDIENSLYKLNSILEVCLQAKEYLQENKENYLKKKNDGKEF